MEYELKKAGDMNKRFTSLAGVILLLFLQACGANSTMPTVIPPQPIRTQTGQVVATLTSKPTQLLLATQLPLPTMTQIPTQIQHVTIPGEPSYIPDQMIADCSLGKTIVPNQPIHIPKACDNSLNNFIERPVTSDLRTYFPYLDIWEAQFGANKDWLYAQIKIYDAVAPTVTGDLYYFFKLDLNFDGRNSNVVVVSVKNLPMDSMIWTVHGVQAWNDNDGIISTIFDQGVGADPDLVWARRSPNTIEMAIKPAILHLGGPSRFAWSAWAYQGTLTPPDIALKANGPDLFQIDKTCAKGFNGNSSALFDNCMK